MSGGRFSRSIRVGLGAGIIALLSAGATVQLVDQSSSLERGARPAKPLIENHAPDRTRGQDPPEPDWDPAERGDMRSCSLLMPSQCLPRNAATQLDDRNQDRSD